MNCVPSTSEIAVLTDGVQGILNRYDPLGVTPTVFAPVTEYRCEAQMFAKLFLQTGVVTIADISNVGVDCLRDPDWIQPEDLFQFSAELTSLFAKYQE